VFSLYVVWSILKSVYVLASFLLTRPVLHFALLPEHIELLQEKLVTFAYILCLLSKNDHLAFQVDLTVA